MHDASRREFLKVAMTGAAGCASGIGAIRRALAIEPDAESTYLDAEHIVILMQENRSFDHAFGTLRGVRGFCDPRAVRLTNGNPVWVQTNDAGESYAPFRLGLLETKSTWMGSLPHSWTDQVDARNGGRHDRWLQAKASSDARYAKLPLTMGYYNRQDIPFYYELADAFTICDQHFCSSLTGTTPNRSYLWSGTIREQQREDSPAHVFNSDMDYGAEVSWPTFPERLEDWNASWKVYQNELYLDVGFEGEAGPWLSNFGDNPLEYFSQYHPRFSEGHRRFLGSRVAALTRELGRLSTADSTAMERAKLSTELELTKQLCALWSEENFALLSPRHQSIHRKAFCTNNGDPAYHKLTEIFYSDGGEQRRIEVPQGDVFHQFRQDVKNGELPMVSWLIAPERFSDHPGSAWYGAWYIAEALNILTQDPETWRKTIFILTYDENDGYFDHVPPFVAPHPRRKNSGLTSASIDPSVEYVDGEFEAGRRQQSEIRDSPIGLGYRVPMIIASPWSRGGWVCSQVFDHTSPLQLIERILSRKFGRECREPNISAWRRTVCGDLTSAFRLPSAQASSGIAALERDHYIQVIHQAQFKGPPEVGTPLSEAELHEWRLRDVSRGVQKLQEPGQRPSCGLPYDLSVNGLVSTDGQAFIIQFEARNELFKDGAQGAAFTVYSSPGTAQMQIRNYAVAAGEKIEDMWLASDFSSDCYCLDVYGPNGFFQRFAGAFGGLNIAVRMAPIQSLASPTAGPPPATFILSNRDSSRVARIIISDPSYGAPDSLIDVPPGEERKFVADTVKSSGWYDWRFVLNNDRRWEFRFAGRQENGAHSMSDPLIGAIAQ